MKIGSKSTRRFAAPENLAWRLPRAQQSRQLCRLSDNEHACLMNPFILKDDISNKNLQTKLYHEKDVIIIMMTRMQEKENSTCVSTGFEPTTSPTHTYRCSRRSIHRAKENPKYCLALYEPLRISGEKGPV